jgi:hypothetical protein
LTSVDFPSSDVSSTTVLKIDLDFGNWLCSIKNLTYDNTVEYLSGLRALRF